MKREYKSLDELSFNERKVYNLCVDNERALNNNTELLIAFYSNETDWKEGMRKYAPETITRIRRSLVEWGHLKPKEEVQKKRMEIANSWKNTQQVEQFTQEADKNIRIINGVAYKII